MDVVTAIAKSIRFLPGHVSVEAWLFLLDRRMPRAPIA